MIVGFGECSVPCYGNSKCPNAYNDEEPAPPNNPHSQFSQPTFWLQKPVNETPESHRQKKSDNGKKRGDLPIKKSKRPRQQ